MPAAPSWLSDPVIRYGFRHSFGWWRLVPALIAIGVELERRGDGRPLRLAVFAFCYAVPQAAAQLLEMEHDGRLDQMRLAGRRPMALASGVFISAAGPWVLLGLMLTAWSILAGGTTPAALVAMAALAGLTTAMAAVSTTVSFARQNVDPRIGVAALIVVAAAVGVIGADTVDRVRGTTTFYTLALIVEAAVIAVCVRRLPGRIVRPPTADPASASRIVLPSRQWLLQWPGIYRGLSLSVSGFMLFALFAPVGILVRILIDEPPGRAPTESAGLYLPALFIGMIAVSLICREDAISGRLDIVRQSSTRVAAAGLQMLIGLWAPFVAASLGLVILASALFGVATNGLLAAVLILVWLAPLPVIEGWLGLWPLTITLPVGVAIMLLTIEGAWPATGAVAAVVWIAAGRMLGHPQHATLAGWPGVAATIAVCAVPQLTFSSPEFPPGLTAASTVFALSPILIDPSRESRIDRWGQPAAITLTVFLATALRLGVDIAAWATVLPIALWHAARRIRQWSPDRPVIQGAARLVILIAGMVFFGNYVVPRFDSTTAPRWPVIALTAALSLAVVAEVVYRITTAAARRRRPIPRS